MTETLSPVLPDAVDRAARALLERACDSDVSIATAESCTGGLLASLLTDVEGASHAFERGFVVYTNEAKAELLGIPIELIEREGAVSTAVARAMADGALARFGADTAVGITGIAGPGGGSEQKPVGTVCFGLAVAGRDTVVRTLHLPGDRSDVRERSTTVAMHLLREHLGRTQLP